MASSPSPQQHARDRAPSQRLRWWRKGARGLGTVATGILVFVAISAARSAGWLEGTDLWLYDRYLRLSIQAPAESPSDVVLVLMDENDIEQLGHWPISDAELTETLRMLGDSGARAIGLDIYRNLPVPPGTDALASLLASELPIFAVRKFGGTSAGGVPGPPVLEKEAAHRVGFNDIPVDPDEAVRRALLFLDDGEGPVDYAFALRVALHALAQEGISATPDPRMPEHIRLGETTISPLDPSHGGYVNLDDAGYQMLLDFERCATGFQVVRLSALPEAARSSRFRDKIVLIGVDAISARDHLTVPCSPADSAIDSVPGVALHAQVVDQLLRIGRGAKQPTRVLGEQEELALVAIATALGCGLGLGVVAAGSALFGAAATLGLAGAGGFLILWGGYFAFGHGIWIPVVAPLAGWVSSIGVVTVWTSSRERTQRAMMTQIFSRSVSKKVADEIWRLRDEILVDGGLSPRRVTLTTLFADMRGYTSNAEKMDAQELMDWVNTFMAAMTGQITAFDGVVDDFFGDGIKANFGLPPRNRSDMEIAAISRSAVACALEMEKTLDDLNSSYDRQGLPRIAMRIGINTGPVVVGMLGSADREKYTSVGESAIVAQRLEAYDSSGHDFEQEPCRILISESTRAQIGEDFETTSLGAVQLKGKQDAVEIYKVQRAP